MMTTTYHVAHQAGRSDAEAAATIHFINDTAFSSGDNRSWDATRALVNALFDANEQERLGISIEAEQSELVADD